MKPQIRFKRAFVFSVVFALNAFLLSSCNSKNTLETFSFDVARVNSLNEEDRTPAIKLFSSKDDFDVFFESDNFEKRSGFDADLERFENEFGFELFDVVYFGQLLNSTWRVEANISENKADKIEINFAYVKPDSDTCLPADNYYEDFYLLEKEVAISSNKEVIFKIGNDIIYSDTSKVE